MPLLAQGASSETAVDWRADARAGPVWRVTDAGQPWRIGGAIQRRRRCCPKREEQGQQR